jgi:8-oxo-dGTP diphosphatase
MYRSGAIVILEKYLKELETIKDPAVIPGTYTQRDLVDHDAMGCVVWDNSHKKIVMLEHVKYGFWTIPVGKVEEGQTLEQGLKQEMWEELGIRVQSFKILAKKPIIQLIMGKRIKEVNYVCEVLRYTGTVKNKEPKKHRQLKWMTVEEIQNLPFVSHNVLWFLELRGIKRRPKK